MELKDRLVSIVNAACDEERKYIASLSKEQLEVQGLPDHWSPKDEIAHIAYWKMQRARAMAIGSTEPLDGGDDIDHVNEGVFEKYRDMSWRK